MSLVILYAKKPLVLNDAVSTLLTLTTNTLAVLHDNPVPVLDVNVNDKLKKCYDDALLDPIFF